VTLRSTKPRNDKPKPATGRTQGAALKSKNEDIRNDRYSFQKKKEKEMTGIMFTCEKYK
jgi:hypothetical protein